MKRLTKLKEIANAIERIKNQKVKDFKTVENLKQTLNEEEKISRNYLQIIQKGIFSKNMMKKALKWNERVIDLKHELYALIK